MNKQNIADHFTKILAELINVDEKEITADTDIILDLEADELDMIELTMAVEEEFNLEISDEDLTGSNRDKGGLWRTRRSAKDLLDIEAYQLRRVGQWVTYITKKVQE